MVGIDTIVIAALISSLVGPVIVKVVDAGLQMWRDRKETAEITSDPLEDAINNSEVVNNYLNNLASDFEFDRAWISMFHNGGHFYPTGKSIQKFSIFYEVTKPGVSMVQHQFVNTPVGLMAAAIAEVYKNGRLMVDIEDMEMYGLEPAMVSTGTMSTFLFALKNLEGKFFGIVGFDMVKDSRKLTNAELELLQAQINTLSGYIFEYLHVKSK